MDSPDANRSLPDSWRREVEGRLETGESVLAWFEPDLDLKLRYAPGIVVLTDRRLLAQCEVEPPAEASPVAAAPGLTNGQRDDVPRPPMVWQSWPLTADATLSCEDRGGAGVLQLTDGTRRFAHWRYTPAAATAAHRFAARHVVAKTPEAERNTAGTVCPSCGAVITSDDGVCAACSVVVAPKAISSLFRLVGFARPWTGMIVVGLLLTFASTAVGLIPPGLTMPLLDKVIIPYQNGQTVNLSRATWYLLALAGAAVLAWALAWVRTYVLATVSEKLGADLRRKAYAHLQSLSLEFFGGKRTGDLIARVGTDTDKVCTFLTASLISFISNVLMISMTAVVLLWIDPMLAVVSLAPFPLIVWLVHWVRTRLRHGFRQSTAAFGELNSVLADTIPGVRVVKAFAQEDREIQRFQRTNLRLLDINNRVNILWSFFEPTVKLLTEGGLLVVWAFGCWQVIHRGVTVGVLTAFITYISRFFGCIEPMIYMVSATQRAGASAQRIFEILDRVPTVPDPVKPVHPGRLEGAVELRGVRFKYGTREVLHGLDLAIRPGELIGLVGASGAGKSTLINLICRFYDVSEGTILIDGTDVRSFPTADYRKNIGIVLQDPFLFYGTIAENIAYGRPNTGRDEIVAAARAARAHEFILRLPDGYDSLVGERGQSLSGGERQRVSIARALLIDPRILILDEATSSVDTETEREIQAALENLIRGRTTIAIAHRLSTLRRADRLVVLQRGQIVEIGNHQELIDRAGVYSRLHNAQLEMVQGVGV